MKRSAPLTTPQDFDFEVLNSFNIYLKVDRGASATIKCSAKIGIGVYRAATPPPLNKKLKESTNTFDITNSLHSITLSKIGNAYTFNVAPANLPDLPPFQASLSAQARKANMLIIPGNPNIPLPGATHWVIGADDVRSGIDGTKNVVLGALDLPADGNSTIYVKFQPVTNLVGSLIFYSSVNNVYFRQIPTALATLGIYVYKSSI